MARPMDISHLGPKYCKHPKCAKLLIQGDGEANSKFARREHCDKKCSSTNPLLHKAQSEFYAARRKETESKTCVMCPNSFSRGRTESRKVFAKRETCSRKCCDANRVAKRRAEMAKIKKICENPDCGRKFSRRITGKHIETEKKFNARKTCSTDCGHVIRKTTSSHIGYKKTRKPVKKKETPPPLQPSSTTPSEPQLVEVWRPESWGGPKLVLR